VVTKGVKKMSEKRPRQVFSRQEYFQLVNEIKAHIREVQETCPELSVFQALQESDYPFPFSPAKRAIKEIIGQWPDSQELKRWVMTDWDYQKYVQECWADYRSVYG
jgi:hypothetical protein